MSLREEPFRGSSILLGGLEEDHGGALDFSGMLEEFDGATMTPTVLQHKVPVWVQIHKLPPLYRSEAILKMLAARTGEEVMVDMPAVPTGDEDFYRVRVNWEAYSPLVRLVTLTPEGRDNIIIQVKYEKLPTFCYHCGLMGHCHLECGTGEYSEAELQFEGWMIADEETWRPGTPKVRFNLNGERDRPADRAGNNVPRGRGGQAGRGSRSHEGVWKRKAKENDLTVSRKRGLGEAGLDGDKDEELKDIASSPLKTIVEDAKTSNGAQSARKQLHM